MKGHLIIKAVLLAVLAGRAFCANNPPAVVIESPKNGSRFAADKEIEFRGKATDLEDGSLSGGSLVWKSDIDNTIGTGESFRKKLSPGVHFIVLTAKDSGGRAGTSSVFIEVKVSLPSPKIPPKPKQIPISKAAKDESKSEKIKIKKQAEPSLEFTFVPPFGSFEDLKGRALNAGPGKFSVVVCIMKGISWWARPSPENPVTKINKDGTWVCDITTGKGDEIAIKIIAFLVPAGYKPPRISDEFIIPKELISKGIARVEVTRKITTPGEFLKEMRAEHQRKLAEKRALEEKLLKLEQERDEIIQALETLEEAKKYFPLDVGNSWKYKRIVMPGKEILYFFRYTVIKDSFVPAFEGKSMVRVGRQSGSSSGIETMKILSRQEDNFTISLSDKDRRSGYYCNFNKIDEITIAFKHYSGGTIAIWETVKGEDLQDSYLHAGNYYAVFTPNISLGTDAKKDRKPSWILGCTLHESEIVVPAGRFRNCLKNTYIINEEGIIPADETPWFRIFKTYRFFAKDVGLVKEVQYDSNGEVTYKLELTDYNVKGDRE